MALWEKIVGTFSSTFQLGKSGPKLKSSAGVVEHRNAADSAYAVTRGADPVIADDLVTKRYGDANYGGSSTLMTSHVVAADYTIPADTSVTIARYVKVNAGVTLKIGAGGDLVVL